MRGYSEYQLKILLNLHNVKLGPLAMSLGLLVLPNIGELKQFYLNFKKYEGDLAEICYADKHKEAARQKRMADKQEKDENELLELENAENEVCNEEVVQNVVEEK